MESGLFQRVLDAHTPAHPRRELAGSPCPAIYHFRRPVLPRLEILDTNLALLWVTVEEEREGFLGKGWIDVFVEGNVVVGR